MNSTIIKLKCQKHGKHFCAELKQIKGTWKVVNFIPVSTDEYNAMQSEIRQDVYLTNSSLVACRNCGNRIVSGCSCASSILNCCNKSNYDFNCIYCRYLNVDFASSTQMLPYNKWAGISNIPDAIKDKYGNPAGQEYDLARNNSFLGYRIIVLNLCDECSFDEPRKALNTKGFEVVEYTSVPALHTLINKVVDNKTQIWIVSDRYPKLNNEHLTYIKKCFESGIGIYIWGDNDPYYVDANKITHMLFNTQMEGNRPGEQILGIQSRTGGPGIIANHLITTGISSFFEGITIAEIKCNSKLTPLVYGSEGQVITAYYDHSQRRALVDGAFTRLCHNWESAGTDRYIVNAAAWLANLERFGYHQ